MYSSVQKLDIVFTDESGAKIGVQTDHRDAAEIAADWDRAVLFAAARVVNARRAVPDIARLRFAFPGAPEPRMSAWLRSMGVDVEGPMGEVSPATGDDADALWAAVNASTIALGEALFAQHGATPDAAGLGDVCDEISSSIYDVEDETALWTGVLELAAVTFVALRAVRPDVRVIREPRGNETLPFLVVAGELQINVFGKAERFARHGASESPVQLLVLMADDGEPDGPVVYNLRPPDWGGKDMALTVPIFPRGGDEEVPLLALCRDLPNTVKSIPHDTPADQIDGLRAEAVASLAKVKVQVDKLGGGPGQATVRVVHGDYYAAEKVFDPAFMKGLADEIGSPLLTVGLPCKGTMFVCGAEPADVIALQGITGHAHDDAAPNQRLSKTLFGWHDGALIAVVRLNDRPADEGSEASNRPPDPPPTEGFFQRWFGWLLGR